MGSILVLIIAVMATAPVHLDNRGAGHLGDARMLSREARKA